MNIFQKCWPVERLDASGKPIPSKSFYAWMDNNVEAAAVGAWQMRTADRIKDLEKWASERSPEETRKILNCGVDVKGLIFADGTALPYTVHGKSGFVLEEADGVSVPFWDVLVEQLYARAFPREAQEALSRELGEQGNPEPDQGDDDDDDDDPNATDPEPTPEPEPDKAKPGEPAAARPQNFGPGYKSPREPEPAADSD